MAQAKTTRLLDLVALLLRDRYPVPKARIRDICPEYQRATPETFDRIFERDKQDLRAIGVPVKAYHIPSKTEIASSRQAAQYDSGEVGYWIDPGEYFMPRLDLATEEWLTLKVIGSSLAGAGDPPELASVWQKLECQVPVSVKGRKPEMAMALGRRADAGQESKVIPKLMEALRQGRRIEFSYRGINRDEITRRQADPLYLVQHGGIWYLLAFCRLRNGIRVFKASRIESLKILKDASVPVPGFDPKNHIGRKAWEFPVEPECLVKLAVRPEEAWMVRAALGSGARWTGQTTAEVPVRNPEPFIRWAGANCDRVRVLEPEKLADRIADRLERTREAYRHA